MVFNTMYTPSLSHEASRMGETTGPRLQDGVSLVPGRDSACALAALAHRDDPRRAGAVGRGAQCGGLCESIERRPEEDLERQLARLVEHATSKGLARDGMDNVRS